MSENRDHDRRPEEPPAGGRQDHDAMQAAAMRPLQGPGSADTLAAIGGNELPGRRSHGDSIQPSPAVHEPIPGERDATTLTHREPGAMGGRMSGEDTPPDGVPLDEALTAEREREGGGGQ